MCCQSKGLVVLMCLHVITWLPVVYVLIKVIKLVTKFQTLFKN